MELIQQAYNVLMTAAVLILALLVILSLIRSVLGPGISDRIIAVNMIGTMTIVEIAMFALYLRADYV